MALMGMVASVSLMTLAPACLSLPAQAQSVACTLSAAPLVPSASTEAFGSDVEFSATGRAECLVDGDPAAQEICISARRQLASGTTEFWNGAATIPYAVEVNGVVLAETDAQVFTGNIPATGFEFAVEYLVRSGNYAGKGGGTYQATISWTIHWSPGTCS